MFLNQLINNQELFSEFLFEKMKVISPGIHEMELYEFRYGLTESLPEKGWGSVDLDDCSSLENRVNNRAFYDSIQIKPKKSDRIVLDPQIIHLTQMLFKGLVTGDYSLEWVDKNFYFDIRSFFFYHRTVYFTEKVLKHLNGKPFISFEKKQKILDPLHQIGYKDFREANDDIDRFFIKSVKKIISVRGIPILLAIAGATAAGKTEIVERLSTALNNAGQKTVSIELDNFFTDRDHREALGIDSRGKEAYHMSLLLKALEDITHGKNISIPRYNFIDGSSSHGLDGKLNCGSTPIEVEPADIIFIEGNFPFLIDEIMHLIGIKVVYLTDDPVRLKRKWKRDIDYRKKYDPSYFRNRYFKDQFIMSQIVYQPQMEVCDMTVDTTSATVWVTPEIARILDKG